MPCPHYQISISTRTKNASAISQAAYQAGERLYDERCGRTRDYSKKKGVVYREIMLPENAPGEYRDRQTLWNAVEASEKRWNAQLARRLVIALPRELEMEDSIRLIREHVWKEFVSRGMIADIAVHDPGEPGHNPHAHVMLTVRPLDRNGRWTNKSRIEYVRDRTGKVIRDKNGKKRFRKVFVNHWNDRENARNWRLGWQFLQNEYLKKAGRNERVNMQSYASFGSELIPSVHMGQAATALEAKGIKTDIGNLNREIREYNRLVKAIRKAIEEIRAMLRQIWEAFKSLSMDPGKVSLYEALSTRFYDRKSHLDADTDTCTVNGYTVSMKADDFEKVAVFLKDNWDVTAERIKEKLDEREASLEWSEANVLGLKEYIKLPEQILRARDTMKKFDAVHREYESIHWEAGRKKFYSQHRRELNAWSSAADFFETNVKKYADLEQMEENYENTIRELKIQSEELEKNLEAVSVLRSALNYIYAFIPELKPEERIRESREKPRKQSHISLSEILAKEEARQKQRELAERERKKQISRDDDMEL